MVRIAVCDDMEIFIRDLKKMVEEYPWREGYSVDTFRTAEELIKAIQKGQQYDILIMDIFLGEAVKGTDVAVSIKKLNPATLIIYISSYECFYPDMVQAEPFKFLSKPVLKEELYPVLDTAYARISMCNYTYSFNNETHIVNLKDIIYMRSEHRKVYIKDIKGAETFFYSRLDMVEKEIEGICSFYVRINKSYLVNMNYITGVRPNHMVVMDECIPITRKYKDSCIKKIIKRGKKC